MKRILITLIFTTLLLTSSMSYTQNTDTIQYGIFSNNSNHYLFNNLTIHHYFTTWNKKEDSWTKNAILSFNKASKRNQYFTTGLLTVEPWSEFDEGQDRLKLMNNIANGLYEERIQNICEFIQSNLQTNIILRWGHEMDLYQSSRYPWAINDHNLFKKAYTKWVDTCRKYTSKAKFMWSPAGNINNINYYPGDNYVDYVGMSWYSYPAFEWYSYNKILNSEEIMNWKYNELKQFNKPIMIGEYGMAEQNKTDALQFTKNKNILKSNYPLIHSIILFSDYTESWIPSVISSPDWRIPDSYLKEL
jgi:endoglucanase